MTANAEFAKAKELLEAAGFVVLREKSYRQAQERQRIAECRREGAEEARAAAMAWARDCLTEERRLRDRLTFVYGIAQAHGATTEELSGSPVEIPAVQINIESRTGIELSDQDKARMREALWQR